MIRLMLPGALLFLGIEAGQAQAILRVGDQKGNAQAVMEAAGVLKDVPYRIAWKEFVAAAPLLEALCADAIETGGLWAMRPSPSLRPPAHWQKRLRRLDKRGGSCDSCFRKISH